MNPDLLSCSYHIMFGNAGYCRIRVAKLTVQIYIIMRLLIPVDIVFAVLQYLVLPRMGEFEFGTGGRVYRISVLRYIQHPLLMSGYTFLMSIYEYVRY
ncbi:hypothetical protein F4815DRAFT_344784 [Daldinia loculata]|nr:hypothetical protein F4815DRAFT_344784 [Daldinia loculata]